MTGSGAPLADTSDSGRAVSAVIFDWGGTITPWHTVDLREQWQVFARGMGAIACSGASAIAASRAASGSPR